MDDHCDSKVRSRSTRLLLVDLAGSESTAEAHDGALVGLLLVRVCLGSGKILA